MLIMIFIFFQIFDFIDLALNIFKFFFLVRFTYSLWDFLSFSALVFVKFLLLKIRIVFHDFTRLLHLNLNLVGKHSATASMQVVTKSKISTFGICLSDVSYKVSNLFFTVTVFLLFICLLASKEQSNHEV